MTDQEKQAIIEAYSTGLNIKQVADKLHYGKRQVHRILQEGGALRWRKITTEMEQVIVEEFKAGASQNQLHIKHKCTRHTISNVLKRNNVDVIPWEHVRLKADQIEELRRQWQKGVPRQTIMKYYGISGTTLNRWIKLLGESLRRSVASGENHGKWKGGRVFDENGYILVWMTKDNPFFKMANSQGYVREHRYVIAEHLGRPLLDNETVHHINGDKQDNRIENLQLRIGQHGSNQAYCCADCGSRNIVPIPLD